MRTLRNPLLDGVGPQAIPSNGSVGIALPGAPGFAFGRGELLGPAHDKLGREGLIWTWSREIQRFVSALPYCTLQQWRKTAVSHDRQGSMSVVTIFHQSPLILS